MRMPGGRWGRDPQQEWRDGVVVAPRPARDTGWRCVPQKSLAAHARACPRMPSLRMRISQPGGHPRRGPPPPAPQDRVLHRASPRRNRRRRLLVGRPPAAGGRPDSLLRDRPPVRLLRRFHAGAPPAAACLNRRVRHRRRRVGRRAPHPSLRARRVGAHRRAGGHPVRPSGHILLRLSVRSSTTRLRTRMRCSGTAQRCSLGSGFPSDRRLLFRPSVPLARPELRPRRSYILSAKSGDNVRSSFYRIAAELAGVVNAHPARTDCLWRSTRDHQ